MHIFTAQIYMELCLNRLYLFNRAFALIISQKQLSNIICSFLLHLQMGDDMTQPHKKALSKPFIGELNLLIVF